MTTEPDPQIVRQLAREQILNHAKNLAQDDVTVFESVIEKDICIPLSVGEQEALSDDVLAEIGRAQVTVSWPDEHATTGRPAAEDVRQHLALRARAVNDEVLRNPEVLSVARADGHAHALTESVVRTLLAERDALAAYVDRLAAPNDEAIHAAAILRGWFKSEGSLVMDEEDLGHVQTVLTDYERITAEPQYLVNGQPVDRESYEAWADACRETDYDEAGIYYDEHDDDENGGLF